MSETSHLAMDAGLEGRRLRQVLDGITDSVVVVDRDFRFVYANAAALRMVGKTLEEIVGLNHWEFLPELRDTVVWEEYHRAMETGVPAHFEYQSPRSGKWLEARAFPSAEGLTFHLTDITHRKQSASMMRELTDAVPGLVGLLDNDLVYRFCNLAYEEWFERSRDQIVGRFMGDVIGMPAFERAEPFLRRALAGEVVRYEAWLEFPNHGKRYVRVRYTPQRGADGRIQGIYVMVWNDTDTQVAQEEIATNERRLRRVIDAGVVPMGFFTSEGRYTGANDALLDLFGYSREELERGEFGWRDFVPEDWKARVEASVAEFYDSGRIPPYEREFLRRDGTRFWGLVGSAKIGEHEGLDIIVDISQERAREAALQFLVDLEEATRALDDPEEVMAISAKMLAEHLDIDRCVYAQVDDDDEHFTIQGNYTRDDVVSIVGRFPLADMGEQAVGFHRQGLPYVVSDVEATIANEIERRNYLDVRIHAVISVPVVKRGRFVAGMAVHSCTPRAWTEREIALVQMVCDRCWASIERIRVYQEMEQRVAERTSELLASNEALTGFTYHVSHDLRAPLRSIVSTSRIVQEDYGDRLPPEAFELLDRQVEAGSKLGRLIDDLLSLSRLSRAEISRQLLDLSAMAADVAEEARSLHPDSVVAIEIEPNLAAHGDPRLLRLALLNLIENGVKYSPAGGTLRFGRRDGAFYVSDEGIGIDPRYAERIFEPFQRLHRDDEFAGTGIGLSNAQRVIQRHGGKIWVESQPGAGATFFFRL